MSKKYRSISKRPTDAKVFGGSLEERVLLLSLGTLGGTKGGSSGLLSGFGGLVIETISATRSSQIEEVNVAMSEL